MENCFLQVNVVFESLLTCTNYWRYALTQRKLNLRISLAYFSFMEVLRLWLIRYRIFSWIWHPHVASYGRGISQALHRGLPLDVFIDLRSPYLLSICVNTTIRPPSNGVVVTIWAGASACHLSLLDEVHISVLCIVYYFVWWRVEINVTTYFRMSVYFEQASFLNVPLVCRTWLLLSVCLVVKPGVPLDFGSQTMHFCFPDM